MSPAVFEMPNGSVVPSFWSGSPPWGGTYFSKLLPLSPGAVRTSHDFCLLVFRGATRLTESLVSSFSSRLWCTENMCFLNDGLSTQGPGAGAPSWWEAASVRGPTMSRCSPCRQPDMRGTPLPALPRPRNRPTGAPQHCQDPGHHLPHLQASVQPEILCPSSSWKAARSEVARGGGFLNVPEGLFLVFSVAPPCAPHF